MSEKRNLRLIVDAMGGDNAPQETVAGALLGKMKYGPVDIIFTGDPDKINEAAKKSGLDEAGYTVVPCDGVISMEDDPVSILKSKRDSSLGKAFSLLSSGEGDALLSAGSTGAMLMGATSRVFGLREDGVKRCAIATVLPLKKPVLLLDSGANPEVSAEELLQFAKLGAIYSEGITGRRPKIGLVNNGAEETKGTSVYVTAHKLLKEDKTLDFVGNVEGRDIPEGVCDVLVCDGFTGNIILKLSEGFGSFLSYTLKETFKKGFFTAILGLLSKRTLGGIKTRLSSEKYGGAPLLGTKKPVIKAHGSSRREAICEAVGQVRKYIDSGVDIKIREFLAGGEK